MLYKSHAILFILLEIIIIIVYGVSSKLNLADLTANQTYYKQFQDVHVMIFIGFGFLMTFLKHHSWSAVSFNFLISAFTIQISLLFIGMWHSIFCHEEGGCEKIEIDITSLIKGDFAAGAVMITFGALLGKVTSFQLTIMAISEMFFYTLNEHIGAIELKAIDMGGSMYVHMFGAFFGVACTKVYSSKKTKESRNAEDSYNSNLFAMIGTIFLWMYWPSFNGALASGSQQHRVTINTVFALTGSCVFTFITSGLFNEGKYNMEDILNATLSGGVIIGTSSDLCQNPFSALIIGAIGGIVSTFLYNKVSPKLVEKGILYDTCGVLNLHGIPGFLGGLIGAINVAVSDEDSFEPATLADVVPDPENRSMSKQAQIQVAVVVITLAISLVSGALTGLLLKARWFSYLEDPEKLFLDTFFWIIEDNEVHPIKNSQLQIDTDRFTTHDNHETEIGLQKRGSKKGDFMVKVVPLDKQQKPTSQEQIQKHGSQEKQSSSSKEAIESQKIVQ